MQCTFDNVRLCSIGIGDVLAVIDRQFRKRKVENISFKQTGVELFGRNWIHAFANDKTRYGGYLNQITNLLLVCPFDNITIQISGVALADSPVGLAAYILEKFSVGTSLDNKYLPDGGLSKYNLDELLDNVMIYWVTGSMVTSMRIYSEYATKAYHSLPHIKYAAWIQLVTN